VTGKSKKAIRYVRVSRVGGREGDRFISPELQREQIEAVARREGLQVVEVVQELDASGGDASRPGWNRAIEMVERGEVAGICVWNFSRFSRSVRDAVNALGRIEAAGG
jgi:DNA invertase Pin-like site-specific DNA recombinase